MAKTPAECEVVIAEVEKYFNKNLKRCSSSTAGLSVSQPDRILNGVAHLLCNKRNYEIVRSLIAASFQVEIPERFKELKVDVTSYMYACGSAPRFKPAGKAHVSHDEAQKGAKSIGKVADTDVLEYIKLKKDFESWAQAYRVGAVGGFVGLSRSVAKTTADQRSDWSDEAKAAAEQQEAVYAAVLDGGKTACHTLMRSKDIMVDSIGIMAKLQAKRAEMEARKAEKAGKEKPALVVTIDEVKAAPPVKKAKVSKKSKTPTVTDEQIMMATDEEPEHAHLNGTPVVEDALATMYEDVQVPAWDADEGMM